jgi:hypothetical protein
VVKFVPVMDGTFTCGSVDSGESLQLLVSTNLVKHAVANKTESRHFSIFRTKLIDLFTFYFKMRPIWQKNIMI